LSCRCDGKLFHAALKLQSSKLIASVKRTHITYTGLQTATAAAAALCVTDRAACSTQDFDLAANQPLAALVCRLMIDWGLMELSAQKGYIVPSVV